MPSLWNTSFNRLIDSGVSQTSLRRIRQGGRRFTNSRSVFIKGDEAKKASPADISQKQHFRHFKLKLEYKSKLHGSYSSVINPAI